MNQNWSSTLSVRRVTINWRDVLFCSIFAHIQQSENSGNRMQMWDVACCSCANSPFVHPCFLIAACLRSYVRLSPLVSRRKFIDRNRSGAAASRQRTYRRTARRNGCGGRGISGGGGVHWPSIRPNERRLATSPEVTWMMTSSISFRDAVHLLRRRRRRRRTIRSARVSPCMCGHAPACSRRCGRRAMITALLR